MFIPNLRRSLLLVAIASGCALGACSADPAVLTVQRGLSSGFNAIEPDAQLGLRVRADPTLAAAAGVPLITPTEHAIGAETIAYHKRLIEMLKETQEGTLDPNAPLPPGPTSQPPG